MPIGYADFNIRDKLTARNKWETDEATLTLAESTWSSPVSYSTPTTLHNFLLSLTLGTATDITKTAVSFSIAGDVLHQLSFEFAESQYGLGISGGIFNIIIYDIVEQHILVQFARAIPSDIGMGITFQNFVSGGTVNFEYKASAYTTEI